jgi:hypothetical protein
MIDFLNRERRGVEWVEGDKRQKTRDKRQENERDKNNWTKETRVVSYGDTSDWRLAFLDLANNTQKNNKVK